MRCTETRLVIRRADRFTVVCRRWRENAARRASRTAAIGLEMKTGKNHSRRDDGAKCIRNGKAPPRQTDYYYDHYTTAAADYLSFSHRPPSASLRSLAVSLAAIHAQPNTIARVYDCVCAP